MSPRDLMVTVATAGQDRGWKNEPRCFTIPFARVCWAILHSYVDILLPLLKLQHVDNKLITEEQFILQYLSGKRRYKHCIHDFPTWHSICHVPNDDTNKSNKRPLLYYNLLITRSAIGNHYDYEWGVDRFANFDMPSKGDRLSATNGYVANTLIMTSSPDFYSDQNIAWAPGFMNTGQPRNYDSHCKLNIFSKVVQHTKKTTTTNDTNYNDSTTKANVTVLCKHLEAREYY